MLKFSFISVHPQIVDTYSNFGVFASAKKKNIAQIKAVDLREFATDRHGSIDDAPYGGGDGMVMKPDVLSAAVRAVRNPYVILTGPAGKKFTQTDADDLREVALSNKELVFVCGRFAGIDQRFVDKYVNVEFSLGDFVISGGELPSLIICDAILRSLPGVLGNNESYSRDSFSDVFKGGLEFPQYTKPREFEGLPVPEVLLSGNHKKIENWRREQSVIRTKKFRPDLLDEKKS